MNRPAVRDVLLMITGVLFMGISLAFVRRAGYGTDTCSFLTASLSARLGLSFGLIMVMTHFILFIPQLAFGRDLIGIGTVFNMVLVGPVSDLTDFTVVSRLPQAIFTSQPHRSVIFIISLSCFLVSCALYMNSGTGQAPFDAAATLISRSAHLPYFIVRILWDGLTIALGIIVGGRVTTGTVIIALTLGPVVSFIGRMLSGHLTD